MVRDSVVRDSVARNGVAQTASFAAVSSANVLCRNGRGSGDPDPRVWLPRKDLNLDKQDQNLLCYRYTTGHRNLLQRKNFGYPGWTRTSNQQDQNLLCYQLHHGVVGAER